MNLSVGSTGALMVMILITLWIWRRGERPIRSGALTLALITMIVAICLETEWPVIAVKATGFQSEGCWLWGFLVLTAGVHAVSLGAFVGFILATIKPPEAKADGQK